MLLLLHGVSHRLWRARVPWLPRLIYLVIRIVFGAVLPPSAMIGKGSCLAYSGLGVVVHGRSVIGNRVYIGAKVTVGGRSGIQEVPVIGDDVVIGSGAQILGPVKVGRGAKIGANAVVVHDVPAGATVVGIPARVVARGSQPDATSAI